jgi:hypothetical protein
VQRDLGKCSEKGRGTYNKRLGAHLTTDGTTLPAGKWEDFDMVCGELEQYPHSVVEVVGCSNVISYD